jgi:hypothetical protein
MNKNLLLLFLALLFLSIAAPAQTKNSQMDKVKIHPFYQKMYFLGGVFNDPKNTQCGTGFIGWVQYEGQEPELIFVEDVFRNVKVACSAEELRKEGVSCLADGEITFSHSQRGHTYKATMKLMNKNAQKPILQLQRFVDDKRILLCNYRKVH